MQNTNTMKTVVYCVLTDSETRLADDQWWFPVWEESPWCTEAMLDTVEGFDLFAKLCDQAAKKLWGSYDLDPDYSPLREKDAKKLAIEVERLRFGRILPRLHPSKCPDQYLTNGEKPYLVTVNGEVIDAFATYEGAWECVSQIPVGLIVLLDWIRYAQNLKDMA